MSFCGCISLRLPRQNQTKEEINFTWATENDHLFKDIRKETGAIFTTSVRIKLTYNVNHFMSKEYKMISTLVNILS